MRRRSPPGQPEAAFHPFGFNRYSEWEKAKKDEQLRASVHPQSILEQLLAELLALRPPEADGTARAVPPDLRPAELLTVREVASLLRTGRTTVYALLHSGELPYIRLGEDRGYRVPLSTLLRWIEEQQTRGPAGD